MHAPFYPAYKCKPDCTVSLVLHASSRIDVALNGQSPHARSTESAIVYLPTGATRIKVNFKSPLPTLQCAACIAYISDSKFYTLSQTTFT